VVEGEEKEGEHRAGRQRDGGDVKEVERDGEEISQQLRWGGRGRI
jgi:hypothetical protein